MSFERWENRMHEMFVGGDEYEPDEDCPCGCEGYEEDCTYDPEAEADLIKGEVLADRLEDPDDPFNG